MKPKAGIALHEAGVLIHQFDGREDPQKPFAPCPQQPTGDSGWLCNNKGYTHQRSSASVIYAGMREHLSPQGQIPLFSYDGGVVLDPILTDVWCSYATDGSTDYNQAYCDDDKIDHAACLPGCGSPPKWCPEKDHVFGWCHCGVQWCGGSPRPWKAEHLGIMLSEHAQFGDAFAGYGSYKGYNELIIGANAWREHLPKSVEAIFMTECEGAGSNTGQALAKSCEEAERHAREVHAAFVRLYKTPDFPLLRLRINNWEEPFIAVA